MVCIAQLVEWQIVVLLVMGSNPIAYPDPRCKSRGLSSLDICTLGREEYTMYVGVRH